MIKLISLIRSTVVLLTSNRVKYLENYWPDINKIIIPYDFADLLTFTQASPAGQNSSLTNTLAHATVSQKHLTRKPVQYGKDFTFFSRAGNVGRPD